MVVHPDQTAGMSSVLLQFKLYLVAWHTYAFSSGQLLLSANALHSRLLWVCAMTKRPRIAWLGSKLRKHLHVQSRLVTSCERSQLQAVGSIAINFPFAHLLQPAPSIAIFPTHVVCLIKSIADGRELCRFMEFASTTSHRHNSRCSLV